MADRPLIYATAFLRALAVSMGAVLLSLHLTQLHISPAQIGFIVSAGLAGSAAVTLLVTLGAHRIGRRRLLMAMALLCTAGGAVVALASQPLVIAAAAFLGMLNGMGRDRSASAVVEQAILPATTTDADRTRAFAWYNVLQDAGHALGGALAGLPVLIERYSAAGPIAATRGALGLYAGLLAGTLVLYARLSPAIEVAPTARQRLTPESRRVLWRISSLFALDAVAGGFLTTTLLAYFFFERFGAGPVAVGFLFFGARVANALSHLGAAWLARRLGLVNTMVLTHIPSSLLLMTVPFAPSFAVAAALFLIREGLVEMDVPTRQSYVMAVVRPEERTVASGVTQLVRLVGWAVAPAFAGLLMQDGSFALPLLIGAAMKIAYDIMLYFAFRGIIPPEERLVD